MAKATKNETEEVKAKVTEDKEELVPFMAMKDKDRYSDDITVGINGKFWRIQRGKKVLIPRKVYEVLTNSMEAEAYAVDANSALQDKSDF